jgi:hypothetical protein
MAGENGSKTTATVYSPCAAARVLRMQSAGPARRAASLALAKELRRLANFRVTGPDREARLLALADAFDGKREKNESDASAEADGGR